MLPLRQGMSKLPPDPRVLPKTGAGQTKPHFGQKNILRLRDRFRFLHRSLYNKPAIPPVPWREPIWPPATSWQCTRPNIHGIAAEAVEPGHPGARGTTSHCFSINSLIFAASASMAKGLVSTCMPDSRWPLPIAAFSA